MTLEKYWVLKPKIINDELEPLLRKIRNYLGTDFEVYLFKNTKENINLGIDHYGRMNKIQGKIPEKIYSSLLKEDYDFVFLVRTDNPVKEYILKPVQSKDELEISKILSTSSVGPDFLISFSLSFENKSINTYMAEEYLSRKKGWAPIFLVQKHIRRHYKKWISSLGKLIGTIHDNDVIYNDDFWKHLFFNPVLNESKLIDFGNSYISEMLMEDKKKELSRVHSFLEQIFPEKGVEVMKLFDDNYES